MIEILKTFLSNKWLWIILIVAGLGIYIYQLRAENERLNYQTNLTAQNAQAIADSLSKSRDSVQVLAMHVADLDVKTLNAKSEVEKSKNEYLALKTKYDIAVNTIDDLGHKQTVCTGDTVQIPISGKKGIASYDIKATLALKTCQIDWSVILSFDPIDVRAEVFLDEKDGLWKMRTISMTPGVILRGISTIDEDTYKQMKGVSSNPNPIRSYVAIGGFMNRDFIAPGILIKPSNWMFGANYIIGDATARNYSSWYERVVLTVYWFAL